MTRNINKVNNTLGHILKKKKNVHTIQKAEKDCILIIDELH